MLEPLGSADIKHRFSRQHKIVCTADYRRSFGFPLRSSDRYLLVVAQQNTLTYPRLGITVAKKRVKKAVCRNTIKRIIREHFRQHKDLLGGLDIIVILSHAPPPGRLSAALSASLEKHWRKITA